MSKHKKLKKIKIKGSGLANAVAFSSSTFSLPRRAEPHTHGCVWDLAALGFFALAQFGGRSCVGVDIYTVFMLMCKALPKDGPSARV